MTSLTEFFNKHEDDSLKGISHKNNIIKRNIIAHMAVNGECTLSELTKELHISVPTITKLVQELEKAIHEAPFQTPVCPIYQNVDAKPYTDPAAIKANLIAQLTAPVRWTYIVKNMLADGVTEFTELGPGTVLQGLIRKVDANATVESKSTL